MRLPPYPRSSGVEWLGEIPEHWDVKRIKEVSVIVGRIGFRGYSTDDLVYEGEGAVSMSPSNMTDGVVNLDKCTWLSWEKYHESPEIQVQSGDVIMVKTGSTLGKAAFVESVPVPMTINPQLMIFKEVTCSTRFLFYYVSSKVFQDVIPLHNTGSTIPTMTQEGIGKLPFPHPPLPEQHAIAEFLDRETERVDRLVAKKRELIERLKEKRTALISRTVTCGLASAEARAAGVPEIPLLKPSGLDWLSHIPTNCNSKALKHLAFVKTGFAFSSDDFTDEGVPVLRIGDITRDGRIDFIDARFLPEDFLQSHSDVIVRPNDIAMAMTGATIGKVGRYRYQIPALLNQRVCLFRPHPGTSQDYLWYLLNTDFYVGHVMLSAFGGAQPNISETQLLSCLVPVPPFPEQLAIAAYLDRETQKLDALVRKVDEAIERLQEYRTALITAGVTGKIDVRERSKNDCGRH